MSTQHSYARFVALILRDGALTTVLLYVFIQTASWTSEASGSLSYIGLLIGTVIGWIIGRFLHEWGHYFPARLLGAKCSLYPVTKFGKIFEYDMERNTELQFAALGWGGAITHWSIAVLFYVWFPPEQMATIGIVAGSVAYAITATVVELPVLIRHLLGAKAQEAYSFDRRLFGMAMNRENTLKLGGFMGGLTWIVLVFLWL